MCLKKRALLGQLAVKGPEAEERHRLVAELAQHVHALRHRLIEALAVVRAPIRSRREFNGNLRIIKWKPLFVAKKKRRKIIKRE